MKELILIQYMYHWKEKKKENKEYFQSVFCFRKIGGIQPPQTGLCDDDNNNRKIKKIGGISP